MNHDSDRFFVVYLQVKDVWTMIRMIETEKIRVIV